MTDSGKGLCYLPVTMTLHRNTLLKGFQISLGIGQQRLILLL
jgi:hypothetical protein